MEEDGRRRPGLLLVSTCAFHFASKSRPTLTPPRATFTAILCMHASCASHRVASIRPLIDDRNLVTDEMVHERPKGYATSSSDDDSDGDEAEMSMSEAGNSDEDEDSGSSYETDSDA